MTTRIEDRFAILELIANFAYTWDSKDAEGFADLFTEDAVRETYAAGASTPSRKIVSRNDLRDFAKESFAGRLAQVQTRYHQHSTVFTEIDPSTAKSKTMVLCTQQGQDDVAPKLAYNLIFYYEFRRTPARWEISKLTSYSDNTVIYSSRYNT
ncbi:MAG: nuclear transport factor 2 family protein [Chloroflexi bacterium]|nr:nuclear transport factor 2 family protein [Chloroflexota bacterium]